MNADKTNLPWVEKYRPEKFDSIIMNPLNNKIITEILNKNYFPNLLFYGPPGTGKTTTIINLIKKFIIVSNLIIYEICIAITIFLIPELNLSEML